MESIASLSGQVRFFLLLWILILDNWSVARCIPFCASYPGYEVFGDGNYTGFSSICKAAIHAGVISNANGGCFLYRTNGPQLFYNCMFEYFLRLFLHLASTQNGVATSTFNTWFPLSFEVQACDSSFCSNIQFVILPMIIVYLSFLNFLRPQKWLLFSNVVWCSWIYVTFTTFTPGEYVPTFLSFFLTFSYQRLSRQTGFLISLTAICLVLFYYGSGALLKKGFIIERILLYSIPVWIGVNMNYFTIFIPGTS